MTLAQILSHDKKDGRFQVRQYPGIAFYFHSEETEPDEDTEWSGYENPTGRVLMVMVGDDHKHKIDPEDVSKISARAYCRDCGQIGCGSNVYE